MIKIVVVLGLLAIGTVDATAADIRLAGTVDDGWGAITKVTLSGKITKGDAKRLDRLVTEQDSTILFLNSTGGDYREGLALAELLRQKLIRTTVPSGSTCLSACAIAFLGGSSYGEEGTEPFARAIGVGGRLGFHAPFIETGGGELTQRAVEDAYDHAIRTVTDFVRAAGGLGVEAEVAADMMTPQRSDLYFIRTVFDLRRVGAEIHGINPAQQLTPSMIKNLCLNGLVPDHRVAWEEAQQVMVGVLKDLGWTDVKTIPIKTGLFGDVVKGKRAVLPVFEAGEGSGYYTCLVDFAAIDGELHAMNRGYIFTADTADILTAAKGFNKDPNTFSTPDIESGFALRSVEPLARNVWSDELRVGVVPEHTPIDAIATTIADYLANEKPL